MMYGERSTFATMKASKDEDGVWTGRIANTKRQAKQKLRATRQKPTIKNAGEGYGVYEMH